MTKDEIYEFAKSLLFETYETCDKLIAEIIDTNKSVKSISRKYFKDKNSAILEFYNVNDENFRLTITPQVCTVVKI